MAERESIRHAIDVKPLQTEAAKVDFIDFIDFAANFSLDFQGFTLVAMTYVASTAASESDFPIWE